MRWVTGLIYAVTILFGVLQLVLLVLRVAGFMEMVGLSVSVCVVCGCFLMGFGTSVVLVTDTAVVGG